MPTLLSDPSPTVYAILVIMVVGLLLMYLRSGKRGDLIRLLIGAAIAITWVVVSVLVESPREEATRKLEEMSAASKAKHADDIGRQMAESFTYNGKNKADCLQQIQRGLNNEMFVGADVVGFNRGDFEQLDDNTIKVGFEAYPTGYGAPGYRYFCWATFVKERDGQFRMKTFDLYQPAKRPSSDDKPVMLPWL